MSEHAMHSQIPQILNGFGYKGAIMRTHFMMYGYNPTFDVPIGWWTGIDGSKTATIPTYDGEGAAFGKTTIDTWILTRYPGKESPDNMEVFRKRFRHINPLLATRADDSGLRKEELVKEYDNKPKFSWILLDELLGKYPSPEADMVTAPNDFTVRMPWGYCGNEIWNTSRKAENSVLVAERLAAIEVMSKGETHENELDKAWKNLLLSQHHDIQICGLLPDARKLLLESIQKSEKVIRESMQFFAEKISGEGIKQVTVFNPLSWKQTMWIETVIDISGNRAKQYVARCGSTETPVRIISPNVSTDGNNIEVKAVFKAEIEPLSINSYSILPAEDKNADKANGIETDEKNLTVVTQFYEIVLSGTGGIRSIKNVRNGKLITAGNSRTAFLEGMVEGEDCQSSGKWIIHKSTGSAPWVRMTEYGFISDIPYEFEIAVYEDNPRIDCRINFDFNGQKIGLVSDNKRDAHSPFLHEEKLRFKLFPSIDTTSTGIRDLPFVISETKNKYIEGNYWTALSDGRSGIAYLNKGNMGSVKEKDGSFSIPLAYSMYYIWGTRMLYGSYEYEFAVLPFQGDWKDADLHRKAIEFNMPVPVFESMPGKGEMNPVIKPFIIKGDKEVILTALYPKSGKLIARFFKSDEINQVSNLQLSIEGRSITETRMDGQKIKDVNGVVSLSPWEVKTFRIDRE
jgi:hypothetical protein